MEIVIQLLHEAEFIENHLQTPKVSLSPIRWSSSLIKRDGISKVYIFSESSDPPGNIENQTIIDDSDIKWYQIDLSQSIILRDKFPFFTDSAYNYPEPVLDPDGRVQVGPNGGAQEDRRPLQGTLTLPYFWFVRGDGVILEHAAGEEMGENDRGGNEDEGNFNSEGLADMELNPYIMEIDPSKWDDWEIDPYATKNGYRWIGAPPIEESYIKTMAGKNVPKLYKGLKRKPQVRQIMSEWRSEKVRRNNEDQIE